MSTEGDNDLDEGLRRELARLPRELIPPKGLEARVVAALRESGWLAAARPRPNPWRLGGAVAAGLALLLAGFWLGRQGGHRGHPPAVPSYLLMLREGADFKREPWPQARMTAETAAWARRRLGVRHFVVGEKLEMDGWVLTSSRVAGMSPMHLHDSPAPFFVTFASRNPQPLALP